MASLEIHLHQPQRQDFSDSLLFITETAKSNRLANHDTSNSHAIRVHAAKAGKISRRNPNKNLPLRPLDGNEIQDFRSVKKEFTSRIKLESWVRKSGRKKRAPVVAKTEEQTIEPDASPPPYSILQEPALVNPFPIKFFSSTNHIISYYMRAMPTNSIALNPDRDWFDFFRQSPVTMQAMLSIVGRVQCLLEGTPESIDVLRHQTEAVRLINEGIAKGQDMNDDVILAVAILVNQDVSPKVAVWRQY
jgi:hypothetical protein